LEFSYRIGLHPASVPCSVSSLFCEWSSVVDPRVNLQRSRTTHLGLT